MNIKLPPLNMRTIGSALVLTVIATAGTMVSTYYGHRCTRKTMRIEQENWKERYAISMSDVMDDIE